MTIRRYKKIYRRCMPCTQPDAMKAANWLEAIPDGPHFIIPTTGWTQDERDRLIEANHLSQLFLPNNDGDITRGILVKQFPYFIKGGSDHRRARRRQADSETSRLFKELPGATLKTYP